MKAISMRFCVCKFCVSSLMLPIISRVLGASNAGALLLGGDTTTRSATAVEGGRGMSRLLTRTRPTIARHLGDAITHATFVTNPARAWQRRLADTRQT
jgi:hypothetical protein